MSTFNRMSEPRSKATLWQQQQQHFKQLFTSILALKKPDVFDAFSSKP